MHTCAYTLIPSVIYIHLLMRTCIMTHAVEKACLSGVQQTECCHTVDSNTTDESCRECANVQTETQGDAEMKTVRGMQRDKKE